MNKFLRSKIFFILLIAFFGKSYSQQVFTIDNTLPTASGNYASFTDAFNYLNGLASTTESITFNVATGQQFDEKPPILTVLGSSQFPIIFQKNGTGNNPVINYSGVVASGNGLVQITSSAYITFDGIDLSDATPSDANIIYSMFYATISDNLTFKNCNISDFSYSAIWLRTGTKNVYIDKNNIFYSTNYSISSSAYSIYSQQYSTLTENINITNNKLQGLKNTLGTLYGIRTVNASGLIANNIISFNNCAAVSGITVGAATAANGMNMKVYHNTVYISGTSLGNGSCFNTSATFGNISCKNNIFINNSLDNTQYLMYVPTTAPTLTLDFDYNIFNCSQSTSGFTGHLGGLIFSTLADWQFLNLDIHSKVLDAEFANASNSDFHLAGTSIGNFALAGIGLPEITTDFENDLRDTQFPYSGADENLSSLNIHVNTLPSSLDFGIVYTTQFSDLTFDIKNDGVNPVIVNDISFNQTLIPFEMSLDGISYFDNLTNIEILAGEAKTIHIKFSPTEMLDYDFFTKILLNNGQILELNVKGNGRPLGVQLDILDLDFGILHINKTSEIQTFNIENTINDNLIITNIQAPAGFLIRKQGDIDWLSEILEFTINGLSIQAIEVIFNPSEQVIYDNQLIINTNIQVKINLVGRGQEVDFEISELGLPIYYGSTALGDYDNDGDLDIFVAGYTGNGSNIQLYKNEGNLNFTPISTNIAAIGAGTINLIDIDNDNDLDLFTCGQLEFGVIISRLYENQDGIYNEINRNFVALQVAASDWADFDNDGDQDLIMTGGDTTSMVDLAYTYIYENVGNKTFEVYKVFDGVSNGDIKWADYDNDGDQDFAITGRLLSNKFISQVYQNNNGIFEQAVDLFGVRYSKLDWGDYDNDGDFDLIVSGSINSNETDYLPAESAIYRNDGSNIFTDINPNILAIQYGDIKWVDLNQDGKLDIAMNGIYSYTDWIGYFYLNRGNDIFELAIDTLEALKYPEMQFGDLDGDLDLDMIFTGRFDYMDYRCQILKNNYDILNTKPNVPIDLNYTIDNYNINLTWSKSNDLETPQNALTYNLRFGTQTKSDNLYASMSDNLTDFRLIPNEGNVGFNTNFNIPYLPNGTYFASVQAIDNSYINSNFSNELEINIDYNNTPFVLNQLENQSVFVGNSINYQINENIFDDIDLAFGDFLTYSITLSDGSDLPSWLNFDPLTQTFSGSPLFENVGIITIKIEVTDLSGAKAFDEFDIEVIYIDDIQTLKNKAIKIYPNPTSKFINVDLKNFKNSNIEIINTLGQTIYTENNINNQIKTIDLSDFAKGIYFINIQSESQNYKSKFILN